MIEKWFETFTLLARQSRTDDLGGEFVSYAPQTEFRGALTFVAGDERTAGGQMLLQDRPVLLHEFDLTLQPGDYVRREKDSAVYRVADCSDRLRAPAFSGLRFAQVQVERTVYPC